MSISSQSGLCVPGKIVQTIEQELSQLIFHGVPIGSTLGDIYYLQLFLGHTDWSTASVLRDWLRCRYYRIRKPWGNINKLEGKSGRILFTWLSDWPGSRDLVLPVVEAIDPRRCMVICTRRSMEPQIPTGAEYLDFDTSFAFSMSEWRNEYKSYSPIWKRTLKEVLCRNGLPLKIMPRLESGMIMQSQRVMASEQLLDRLKPAAVVTEYDRNEQASCLILAAKRRGIPTMTMIHGVINHACGYTPLLADLAFCWGERHRDQMIAMGVEPERLRVVGCPRLNRSLPIPSRVARVKAGLPPDKPLALLATNPILPAHKMRLAWVFCEALKNNAEVTGSVRLHPSEKLEEYAEVAKAFPGIKFIANQTWSLEEAIAAADVVVCQDSGFGNDALIKGKPAVVLDVLPVPLGNGHELVEHAGCPRAGNSRELLQVVSQIISSPTMRETLRSRTDRYVQAFCAAFEEEAARNIADEIMRRLSVLASHTVHSGSVCCCSPQA